MNFVSRHLGATVSPAKILVIGSRGLPDVEGGAEKNAECLFPLIVSAGVDVTLMGLSSNISSAYYKGVKLAPAPTSKILKTDKLLYYIYGLVYALRTRPDIVHFQGLGAAIFLLLYKLFGMKTVVRYGSADYVVGKWGAIARLGFRFCEWQLRFADAIVAVGPALATRLAKAGIRERVHIIANAVDAPVAHGATPDLPERPYVLGVGRITEQKNFHGLMKGFDRFCAQTGSSCDLLIAGGVDNLAYRQKLDALVRPGVRFVGRIPRSNLGHYYAGAAVYVNSSSHEGNSNAVLEAISWGAPILLSDIPENRDFGLDDRHYFDPNDRNSLSEALERVFADRNAYVVPADRFLTWNDVAQRTFGIYTRLVARRRVAEHVPAAGH